MTIQSRRYTFFIPFYDETELDSLRTSLSQKEEVRYAIFEKQECEEEQPSLQGYVVFRQLKSLKAAKNFLHQSTYVEMAVKKTKEYIRSYTQSNNFEEFGYRRKPYTRRFISVIPNPHPISSQKKRELEDA